MTSSFDDHPAPSADPIPGRWAVVIILVVSLLAFFAGASGDIVKGDEVFHAGFARSWADAGLAHRPLCNPLYASGEAPGYYYGSEILWPFGLAALWQLAGEPHYSWIAQAYQALWFALLLTAIYLAGCQIGYKRYGLAALCIAASVPMFTAFSVLLYVDVPAAALATLAILFLLHRQWFWAGVALALAYLTKRNAFFLAAPFFLWVCVEAARAADSSAWRRRLAALAGALLFLAPILPTIALDTLWRHNHLPHKADSGFSLNTILERLSPINPLVLPSATHCLAGGLVLALLLALAFILLRRARRAGPAARAWTWTLILAVPVAALLLLKYSRLSLFSKQQLPSNLTQPWDLITYLGPLLLVLILAYLLRRCWRNADRTDAWLAISLGLYVLIAITIFSIDTDIRYLMPAIPLAILLAARALAPWLNRPHFLAVLAIAAILCSAGTAVFARSQRLLTPSEREVFRYLRVVSPPGSLVLYPGEVVLAEANRPMVWAHILDQTTRRDSLHSLLFTDSPAEITDHLRFNGVAYVCLDRAHTSAASTINLIGGYPPSFVEKLHQAPGLEKLSGHWGDDIELFRVLPEDPKTTP